MTELAPTVIFQMHFPLSFYLLVPCVYQKLFMQLSDMSTS